MGELFKALTEDLSTLVRSEIALAKLEVKETVTGFGVGLALLGGAAFCAVFALAFVLVTITLALDLVMPAWLAALLVTVALVGLAVLLGLMGKKKMSKVEFVPAGTIQSVKSDIESIRATLKPAKENTPDGSIH